MCPFFRWRRNLMVCVLIIAVISALFSGFAHAGNYTWDDYRLPFKQTFRFSTAASALVRVTLPDGVVDASARIPMICRMEKNSPRLRPYLIVNNDRRALYYLGGNTLISIRSDHLKVGENEFLFGDQTSSGDLIFIYELRFQMR